MSRLAAGGSRVTVAGAVAALQAGAPHRGDALLVPGFTGSKEDFAPLLVDLADAGLRVTAIDLPGQYESPGPASPDAYLPDALGEAVRAVARDLGGGIHLLGHSFGGLVSRAAVIAEPGLFRSLTLLSSGPAALAGPRRDSIDLLEPVLTDGGPAAVYRAMEAMAQAEPGYVAPAAEVAEFLERRFLCSVPAGLLGMGTALRTEPDRVAELAATRVSMLVLCGEHDDAWPPAVQEQMAARLGAPFAVVPDAAHSAAVENPDATARVLLDFWLGQPTG